MAEKGYKKDPQYEKRRLEEKRRGREGSNNDRNNNDRSNNDSNGNGKSTTIGLSTPRWLRDYDDKSWSTEFTEPLSTYRPSALKKLIDDFPFLDLASLKRRFSDPDVKHHYAVIHRIICAALTGPNPSLLDTNVLTHALSGEKLPPHVAGRVIKSGFTVLKKPRRIAMNSHSPPTDVVLLDEIAFTVSRTSDLVTLIDTGITRRESRASAVASGNTIECNCCYDDVAFEEMAQCGEGHLFCVDCLGRYASEQLFGLQRTALQCMTTGEDGRSCGGGFQREMLERALPKKVLARLDEAVFNSAVETAGLEDMCKCPQCDYQAMVPATERVFACPAEGCYYESCRECGEPPHFPLKCDEVERKGQTDGRKNVEEVRGGEEGGGRERGGEREGEIKREEAGMKRQERGERKQETGNRKQERG